MDIFDAIQSNDAAAVVRLLDEDPACLHARRNGATPLLWAVYHGHPELAQQLVARGAPVSFAEACALGNVTSMPEDINQRSEDGFPPLGLAIFFGHGELARELIARGADVDAAAENAQRVAPLHAAVAVCDRATLRKLLERGADPNAKQQADFTPLHGAASRGDREAAELLLAHGADRKAKSADGKTAADVARERGYPSVAEFLASQ
ncbi:MAG TPA: ankyrin repeat domain-containing protein [Thermoanaerobaculia bacterium]|jgi:ankyrin repeat protein|nr:ankyrin repeat domain-containing protein [Thermoanaerobaculia bacterium]